MTMDGIPPAERRVEQRRPANTPVQLEIGGAISSGEMMNLSARGAMVRCNAIPDEGREIILIRRDLRLSATVAWVNGDRCGLLFETQIGDGAIASLKEPGCFDGH